MRNCVSSVSPELGGPERSRYPLLRGLHHLLQLQEGLDIRRLELGQHLLQVSEDAELDRVVQEVEEDAGVGDEVRQLNPKLV